MRFARSHHLDRVFATGSHIAVLRALALSSGPASGRTVARAARLTHRACLQALERLQELGLVHREIGLRNHAFTLNRTHVLVREGILPLLELEAQQTPRLARALRKECASFVDSLLLCELPSGGRGSGTDEFSVCAVVSTNEERSRAEAVLVEVLPTIRRQFGVRISHVVLLQAEFAKRARRMLMPVSIFLKDGTVIHGKTFKELGASSHTAPHLA
jgi:DNA-binding transcriptional ArsR family regulator